MQQITKNAAALKPIVQLGCPSLVASLIPLVWRVAAAVRSFFRPRDHARGHGPFRAAAGTRLA